MMDLEEIKAMDHYEKRNGKERVWNFAGEDDKVWEVLSSGNAGRGDSSAAQEQRSNREEGRPLFGEVVQRAKENGYYIGCRSTSYYR